jgi:hypothetical protein
MYRKSENDRGLRNLNADFRTDQSAFIREIRGFFLFADFRDTLLKILQQGFVAKPSALSPSDRVLSRAEAAWRRERSCLARLATP